MPWSYDTGQNVLTITGTETELSEVTGFSKAADGSGIDVYTMSPGVSLRVLGDLTIPWNQRLLMSGNCQINITGRLAFNGDRPVSASSGTVDVPHFPVQLILDSTHSDGPVVFSSTTSSAPSTLVLRNTTVSFFSSNHWRGLFISETTYGKVTTEGDVVNMFLSPDKAHGRIRVDSSAPTLNFTAGKTYCSYWINFGAPQESIKNLVIVDTDGIEVNASSIGAYSAAVEIEGYDSRAVRPTYYANSDLILYGGVPVHLFDPIAGLSLRLKSSGSGSYTNTAALMRRIKLTLQDSAGNVLDDSSEDLIRICYAKETTPYPSTLAKGQTAPFFASDYGNGVFLDDDEDGSVSLVVPYAFASGTGTVADPLPFTALAGDGTNIRLGVYCYGRYPQEVLVPIASNGGQHEVTVVMEDADTAWGYGEMFYDDLHFSLDFGTKTVTMDIDDDVDLDRFYSEAYLSLDSPDQILPGRQFRAFGNRILFEDGWTMLKGANAGNSSKIKEAGTRRVRLRIGSIDESLIQCFVETDTKDTAKFTGYSSGAKLRIENVTDNPGVHSVIHLTGAEHYFHEIKNKTYAFIYDDYTGSWTGSFNAIDWESKEIVISPQVNPNLSTLTETEIQGFVSAGGVSLVNDKIRITGNNISRQAFLVLLNSISLDAGIHRETLYTGGAGGEITLLKELDSTSTGSLTGWDLMILPATQQLNGYDPGVPVQIGNTITKTVNVNIASSIFVKASNGYTVFVGLAFSSVFNLPTGATFDVIVTAKGYKPYTGNDLTVSTLDITMEVDTNFHAFEESEQIPFTGELDQAGVFVELDTSGSHDLLVFHFPDGSMTQGQYRDLLARVTLTENYCRHALSQPAPFVSFVWESAGIYLSSEYLRFKPKRRAAGGLSQVRPMINDRLAEINAGYIVATLETSADGDFIIWNAPANHIDLSGGPIDAVIADMATDVEGLVDSVNSVSQEVDTVRSQTTNINSKVDTIDGVVDGLTTSNASQHTKLDSIQGDVSDTETKIDGLTTSNAEQHTKADNIITNLSHISDDVTDILQDLTTVRGRVVTIDGKADTIDGVVDGLATSNAEQHTKLDSIQADVTSTETKIDGLVTTNGNQITKLDSIQDDVTDTETKVDGLATTNASQHTKIDSVATDIQNLINNVTDVSQEVDILRTQSTNVNAKADTIDAKINSLGTVNDGQTVSLNGITTVTNNIKTVVDGLETENDNQTTKLNSIQSDVTDTETKVDGLTTSNASQHTKLDTISSAASSVNGKADQLITKNDGQTAAIAVVDGIVDDIKDSLGGSGGDSLTDKIDYISGKSDSNGAVLADIDNNVDGIVSTLGGTGGNSLTDKIDGLITENGGQTTALASAGAAIDELRDKVYRSPDNTVEDRLESLQADSLSHTASLNGIAGQCAQALTNDATALPALARIETLVHDSPTVIEIDSPNLAVDGLTEQDIKIIQGDDWELSAVVTVNPSALIEFTLQDDSELDNPVSGTGTVAADGNSVLLKIEDSVTSTMEHREYNYNVVVVDGGERNQILRGKAFVQKTV